MADDTRLCTAGTGTRPDEPGTPHQPCAAYDWTTKKAPEVTPPDVLCELCLEYAARDIRRLPWDWSDLDDNEQSLSQALDTQPSGHSGPPILILLSADALRAEIRHVLTSWEAELRHRLHLFEPRRARARQPRGLGYQGVRQAAGFLAERVRELSRVEAIPVRLVGVEDPVRDVCGVDTLWHLRRLHSRARALLGRTRRTTVVPGSCSVCGYELRRDEPDYEEDPCFVYCGNQTCATTWTTDQYERYVLLTLSDLNRRPRPSEAA